MKIKIAGLFKEEILIGAAGVLVLAGLIVFLGANWSTRSVLAEPPSDNRPTPILVSGSQPRISGDLIVGGNLNVNSGNLGVSGTVQVTGAATTTGTLTLNLNSKANACRQVYMTGTNGDTFCCNNESNCPTTNPYWVVGVRNTSGVIQNPFPPPAQPYNMICCKRY